VKYCFLEAEEEGDAEGEAGVALRPTAAEKSIEMEFAEAGWMTER
jgi:hypothetical protein